MKAHQLAVYQHRDAILEALRSHQVIIVESPTGSGKTTQLPIILQEAGYTEQGVVGVTQPRRIATLGVCEFIAKQMKSVVGEKIGYKMRFEDKTSPSTRLKIMTDGILLQEMKTDPLLQGYSVIMVDEAHERSLNIDFILGLLKQVVQQRPDFKVIISSATINTKIFSSYFNNAPVVSIDTQTYPVTVIYDPPADDQEESLLAKIVSRVETIVLQERRPGDMLIFLPGERIIKLCMQALAQSQVAKKLWLVPLYGMLGKEEQERVFHKPPFGKLKVVIATNIAETSITIDGVTSVIDSGLQKENIYNQRTYTNSLIETGISQAAADQRKGRAGRTQPGMCYRLYAKEDYASRPAFSTQEIFRTDLSEVVLRMAGVGVKDYMGFDFLDKPARSGVASGIETLQLLGALDENAELTNIGRMILQFPLLPRHARIIIEAMRNHPSVLVESCIASAFLSTNNPYLFPLGQELEARQAQHTFRHEQGDFVSYLMLFNAYMASEDKEAFARRYYMDKRTLDEIVNVERQLEEIAHKLGGLLESGGSTADYLTCCVAGLAQFVCLQMSNDQYRSVTADRIMIHPGSAMFKKKAAFIVAGEIVKTTRMYARTVSPLKKEWIQQANPVLWKQLHSEPEHALRAEPMLNNRRDRRAVLRDESKGSANDFVVGSKIFTMTPAQGKKHAHAVVRWEELGEYYDQSVDSVYKGSPSKKMTVDLTYDGVVVLSKVSPRLALKVALSYKMPQDLVFTWPKQQNYDAVDPDQIHELLSQVGLLSKLCLSKKGRKEPRFMGFLSLNCDDEGHFWLRPTLKFNTFIRDTAAALEMLADVWPHDTTLEVKEQISDLFHRLERLADW